MKFLLGIALGFVLATAGCSPISTATAPLTPETTPEIAENVCAVMVTDGVSSLFVLARGEGSQDLCKDLVGSGGPGQGYMDPTQIPHLSRYCLLENGKGLEVSVYSDDDKMGTDACSQLTGKHDTSMRSA